MRLSLVGRPCRACGSDEIDYTLRAGRWWRTCSRCVALNADSHPELQRRREILSGLLIRLHEEPDAGAVAEQRELVERMDRVLARLAFRERAILEMRWGLRGCDHSTLDECGRAFKITRERVRQIEAKGIRKLQGPRLAHMLDPGRELRGDERGR